MFWNKKIKELEAQVAELKEFENGVGKIINDYLPSNEKTDSRYSTDTTADTFLRFVQSVSARLAKLEQENEGLKRKRENAKGDKSNGVQK